ncbi:uncharacterized protein LOC131994647 [Stomoxys calcitrans]|uniref:uncharacterized protein LOC131994647 n=1 Tax=Stomoxys calcitrans TaxID=35570 RepID=UPI0027E32656|nr:uncharacterized protein LOC131994647 [Stomoxys calcitrans]
MANLQGDFIFDSDDLVMFCADFDNRPETDHTDSSLVVALQDLHERWTNVQASYRKIFTTKDEEFSSDFVSSAREKYRVCTSSFHSCKARMMDLQKAFLPIPGSSRISFPLETSDSPSNFSAIKVPPCDTQEFEGSYEEWPSFRDIFTAVYINHHKLSPVQKLYHLRLKVKGPAAGIVRKYQLCAENFELAWEALRSRYENKRILVDNQLKVLLNLKSITSESSDSLQRIQTTINDCLAALRTQDISTRDWDPLLVYLCSTKLPHETLSLWEQSLKSHRELPKWAEMDRFLSDRYEVVERLNSIHGTRGSSMKGLEVNAFTNTESKSPVVCKLCNANAHSLKNCTKFRDLSPSSRNKFVSQNRMCLNCLSYRHVRKDCQSSNKPQTAASRQDSVVQSCSTDLVGVDTQQSSDESSSPATDPAAVSVAQTSSHFSSYNAESSQENTILPTAMVTISHNGDTFKARAFLDQGSEKSFISRNLQQSLSLPTERRHFQILGMGGQVIANSNSSCKVPLFSETHDKLIDIHAIVVPKITRLLPSFFLPDPGVSLDGLDGLELADPNFRTPGHVDLLLGSNVIPNILLEGVKKVCESLVAQATIFGWVISGPVTIQTVTSFSIQANEISGDPVGQQLRMFWEQEEVPETRHVSLEDEYCESLYERTTVRDSDGRYVVRLPFRKEYRQESPLGRSRSQALIQYVRLERSLRHKPEIERMYNEVLQGYSRLNHMRMTNSQELHDRCSFGSFYLPHHAVLKPESRSTKVRVVFNASRRTSSGKSLNDVLYTGPTLQSDLMTLILRWRLYKYVFTGDIEKMYRQILVHEDDIEFQRILFRPYPASPIRDYALKTVTFGVNCAPYLAIRTLIQLAQDSAESFPQAADIIRKETYVDDVLSGAHDPASAIDSLRQLIEMLKSGGFPFKKITSNFPQILNSVPSENVLDSKFLKFHETSDTKTLGIQWNALEDKFSYRIDPPPKTLSITKRQILSKVSKLFDPAGWISPIIIQAKIMLQLLWLEGTQWDEDVKPEILFKWNNFVDGLHQIPLITIPRWVAFAPLQNTQIHGFCDASEKAFCAVIYIRIVCPNSVQTNLLVSKTRVAPIDPISLPRLELCGAVLLSQLTRHVLSELPLHNFDLYLWSDSSITLSWLAKPPCTWKTYIANRVAKIIRNVGNCAWGHVRSHDNPADLGSRGCSPNELCSNSLWWHGPAWLKEPSEDWPKSIMLDPNPPEMRKIEVFHTFEEDGDILERFSRWDKAIRVMAYAMRFYRNVRKGYRQGKGYASREISNPEFTETKNILIRMTQRIFYTAEYSSLEHNRQIPKRSTLYTLNPILDPNGLIRANGRIANAALPYNERHPIILPVASNYCKLFVRFIHDFLLHAEHNLMMRTIREEYYVARLRSAIKKCIRNCKTCTLYKQKVRNQIMAALPTERSSFSLPFSYTGLDFAGPFSIKTSSLRQAPYQKGYVCVFVCFSTKAIHLELCSSLSAESFLAAFARFVGRRGLPQKIMSDNGTNFVGAERKLRCEYDEFIRLAAQDVSNKYTPQGVHWTFIPPNAPHMGGLWEAGVKSFKMHFKKVTQNQKYTFEEFATLLVRIESVLNSRPLSPITDNSSELLALTPGHFLRGAPLVAVPEVAAENLSLPDRWERLKVQQHQFARRWKDEYLKELQHRYKWQVPKENVEVGQLVVVKEDQLPPCEWMLGRITKTHLAGDGAPTNIRQCLLCERYHSLRFCREFLNMDVGRRRREVRRLGYCLNCLARSHKSWECTSEVACRECGGEHHTLLHIEPLPRLTLAQMDKGRVAADLSRLIKNRQSTEQRGRHGESKTKERSGDRSRHDRRHKQTNRNPKVPASRQNVSQPRKILETAMKALQRLQDALV